MTRVMVVPGGATKRVSALARGAKWDLEAASHGAAGDVEAALGVGQGGRPVLFVAPGARITQALRRVLVLHDGTPGATVSVRAGERAALASGADVAILHVPAPEPPLEPGSLPAPRIVDHEHYDLRAWREEFLRRFCRCSPVVSVTLDVAIGRPATAIPERARALRADVMVLTWKGVTAAGRAMTLRAVAQRAPCPVLIVPARGLDPPRASKLARATRYRARTSTCAR